MTKKITPLLKQKSYIKIFQALATLEQVVNQFFDHVMVMDPYEQLRVNRLALLQALSKTFKEVADISLLA